MQQSLYFLGIIHANTEIHRQMAKTTKSVLQDDDVTVKRLLSTNMTGDSMKSTLSSIKALARSKYHDTATYESTKVKGFRRLLLPFTMVLPSSL